MTGSLHISLIAEPVYTLFGLTVTNSLLTTWAVIIAFVAFVTIALRHPRVVPSHIQSIFEIMIEGLYGLFETILHDKVKTFFPILATFFLFILLQNWSGLLPGVGTIGITHAAEETMHTTEADEDLHQEAMPHTAEDTAGMHEADQDNMNSQLETSAGEKEEHHSTFTPLFRAGTADLNTTLALALIAVALIQYVGITTLRLGYLKKFFNFSSAIGFFIGILEIVQEFSRILSFAFRLFGNVFAGEVLLVVMAFLMPVLLPVPFIGMEIFVGFIQALVFTMLTTVFLSLASSHEEH